MRFKVSHGSKEDMMRAAVTPHEAALPGLDRTSGHINAPINQA
jgi:hypothetical protein